MGAYLSKPITEKVMTFEESNALAVVSCSMQGWRTSQEVLSVFIFHFQIYLMPLT